MEAPPWDNTAPTVMSEVSVVREMVEDSSWTGCANWTNDESAVFASSNADLNGDVQDRTDLAVEPDATSPCKGAKTAAR